MKVAVCLLVLLALSATGCEAKKKGGWYRPHSKKVVVVTREEPKEPEAPTTVTVIEPPAPAPAPSTDDGMDEPEPEPKVTAPPTDVTAAPTDDDDGSAVAAPTDDDDGSAVAAPTDDDDGSVATPTDGVEPKVTGQETADAAVEDAPTDDDDGSAVEAPTDDDDGSAVEAPTDDDDGSAAASSAPTDDDDGSAVEAPSDDDDGSAAEAPTDDDDGSATEAPTDDDDGSAAEAPTDDDDGSAETTEEMPTDDDDARRGLNEGVSRVVVSDDEEECMSVAETAVDNPSLTTLVAALTAADLANTLNAEFVGTVFAPTDAAFAALLADLGMTAEELLGNTELLTQVLLIHVIPDVAAFSIDLTDGQELPTAAEGVSVTVSITDGDIYIVAPSGIRARVIFPNVNACDAIVHIIDAVLTPAP